ncbi:MAG: ABC transporter permease [Thermoanaerobaculia bacterium]
MYGATQQLLLFRGLLSTLVVRELKARYRGSVLGFFWSLVNPLLLLGVYTFVFSVIFQPRFVNERMQAPYALFLMTGLFPWTWVATSLLEGTQSLTANAGLLRKAVFPAEVLPMVSVLSNLVHFLFALPVLGGALLIGHLLGYPLGSWTAILLPMIVLLQLLVVGGFALGLAALNVHFKDVKDIVANVLALLFYLTPVVYPLDFIKIEGLKVLVEWFNPFTPFTTGYQEILYFGSVPDIGTWLHMAVWGAVVWSGGTWLFGRLSDSLVEAV